MAEETNNTIKVCAHKFYPNCLLLKNSEKNITIFFAKQFINFIEAIMSEIAHNTYFLTKQNKTA